MAVSRKKFIKSPMNWVGNKYKLLDQLYNFFPPQIDTFIDLFAGGLDVSINTPAKNKFANDINFHIIEIYKFFQHNTIDNIMEFIKTRINEFHLSKYNYEGYIKYRDLYNTTSDYNSPLDLFVLSRFSYNNNIDFNKDNLFVTSFGYDRSDFNLTQKGHTRALYEAIQNIHFSSINFKNFNLEPFNIDTTFLYIDPPYLISDVNYVTKTSAAQNGWTQKNDLELYDYLDKATSMGIKWAMSNLLCHKGIENVSLIEWAEKYTIQDIFSNYSRSSYNARDYAEPSIEVLITNYI